MCVSVCLSVCLGGGWVGADVNVGIQREYLSEG